ncbi:MAG: TolC family protein [Chitinophagaceae bacterium]|nr:TolC family protein [Chitinophagaceae bacterium]
MKPKLITALFLLAGSVVTYGQNVLDGYILKGLESNLALKQRSFDLQKAQLDLKRAQALFYPQVNFASEYTLAGGGRTQQLPIGDLLNGVYSTLNQLTSSTKFPQIENETINFLPNNFHDTRVAVTMPLINTDLRYNRRIKEELINSSQADIDIYKRELVKEIKQSYYRCLQAERSVEIYTAALNVVRENLRVNEKLVKNTMATKEVLLRSKAQVSQVEASLIEARNNQQNAVAYFNFLLNQPLETPVDADSSIATQLNALMQAPQGIPQKREELIKLKSVQKALEHNLRLTQSYHIPRLNAFYNVGFQGFGFRFNGDQFYQLGGLQLQWSLFRGNDNKYRIKQSQTDIDALRNRYDETEKQLSLHVQTAYNNYRSALQSLQSAYDEVESTSETYRFTDRRYREGLALQIELIDARTQMTNAELKYSLAQLAVLTRIAELERATATYTFSQ